MERQNTGLSTMTQCCANLVLTVENMQCFGRFKILKVTYKIYIHLYLSMG